MPTTRKALGGRPTHGSEAKRHVVSCRVTPSVLAKLDAAIAENGRSLAHEVEARLDGFFKLEELFGDPRRLTFMAYLAERIRSVEIAEGGDFQVDPVTWVKAAGAVREVMEAAAPNWALRSEVLKQMLEGALKSEAEAEAAATKAGADHGA